MSVCMYVTRFLEINNYLMLFPIQNNRPMPKLPDDEIMDLLAWFVVVVPPIPFVQVSFLF